MTRLIILVSLFLLAGCKPSSVVSSPTPAPAPTAVAASPPASSARAPAPPTIGEMTALLKSWDRKQMVDFQTVFDYLRLGSFPEPAGFSVRGHLSYWNSPYGFSVQLLRTEPSLAVSIHEPRPKPKANIRRVSLYVDSAGSFVAEWNAGMP